MTLTTLWRGGRLTRAPSLHHNHAHSAAARIELADPEIVLGYATASRGDREDRYVIMTVQREGIQVEFLVDAGALAERLERAGEWRRTGIDSDE